MSFSPEHDDDFDDESSNSEQPSKDYLGMLWAAVIVGSLLGFAIAKFFNWINASSEENEKEKLFQVHKVGNAEEGKSLTYYVLTGAVNQTIKATVTHLKDDYVVIKLDDIGNILDEQFESLTENVMMNGVCLPLFRTKDAQYLEGINLMLIENSQGNQWIELEHPLRTCRLLEETL